MHKHSNEDWQADEEDRRLVEELEGQMLRALLCSAALPEGLDPKKSQASADSLFQKRMRAVERCLNQTSTSAAHAEFRASFTQFQKYYPSVNPDGPCADAKAFCDFQKPKFSPAVFLQHLIRVMAELPHLIQKTTRARLQIKLSLLDNNEDSAGRLMCPQNQDARFCN